MEPPSPSAPGQSADTPRQTNAPSGPTPATLSALLKQAAGGRASFVRVADTTFVLRLTSPAEGSVVEELSWSSRDIDDRIYAARIDPLFADLRAGAPLRCEPRVLECIVSSESGAEIVYQFRETPAGARLAELRAPAWE